MIRRTLVALFGAVLVALAAAAGASALEATIEPVGAIEAPSSGEISFTGGLITVRCPLTLHGTVSGGPIELSRGSQFGLLTDVRIGRCTGGTVERVLIDNRTRAWPAKIETVLPAGFRREDIRGILFFLERAAFQLGTFGEAVRCLYEGPAYGLIRTVNLGENRAGAWRYSTDRVDALAIASLRLISGGEACPANGSFSGSFNLNPLLTLTVR